MSALYFGTEIRNKEVLFMEHVTQKYFDEVVKSTSEILKFDSSLQPATEGAPFGQGAADCLAFFLNLASEMGFETHNYDNYVGEVVFGQGKDFAVLAHLDVVPAGNGWKYPPFGGVINDEPFFKNGERAMKIWGRGALDDKGPAIACLYALKALKDEGFVPARKIKLIVGCNEEAGWECIEHYQKVAVMPEEGFTPDANFPVIYAEKGILHFTTEFLIKDAPMSALKAGEAANMVCDCATAVLTRKAGNKLVGYQNDIAGTRFSYDNTTNILRVDGKSAHGSHPEEGANALQAMLKFFASFNDDCKKAYDLLFDDVTGLKTLEDETGKLTLSPDVASYQDGVLKITTDIRYPATLSVDEVLEKLRAYGASFTVNSHKEPLYNDPNGKLISVLNGVYNRVFGANGKPIAIGGGTYARALKRGCAFGPELPNMHCPIHQPDEYVTFEHLRLMGEVYYEALKAVAEPQKSRIAQVIVRRKQK